MHPAIRILVLVVITVFMAAGGPYVLVAGITLSIMLHSARNLSADAGLLRMVLRMRWFVLSIMILYAWFTPGEVWFPALGVFSPSQQGLTQGLFRCSVLIVVLSLVHWLVHASSREELIQGIYWLARPLTWVGLRPEVMAVRLALVMDTVPVIQRRLAIRPSGQDASAAPTRRIAEYATAVLNATLNEAERAELIEIELAVGRPPAAGEWMLLGGIMMLMTALLWLP